MNTLEGCEEKLIRIAHHMLLQKIILSWHFNGNDYICLQGGTMFPYASTIELEIRPIKNGTMGILGAGNNQIQLMLQEDGKLLVARSTGNSPALKQFVSDIALKYNQWSHIAVVYDCQYPLIAIY